MNVRGHKRDGQFQTWCSYCGDYNECQDHLIPVAYNSGNRAIDNGATVDCCSMCNSLAGNFVSFSVEQKAAYLRHCYFAKFGKYLTRQRWTIKQINELQGMLRDYISSKQFLSALLEAKLENLLRVAQGHKIKPIRNYEHLEECQLSQQFLKRIAEPVCQPDVYGNWKSYTHPEI